MRRVGALILLLVLVDGAPVPADDDDDAVYCYGTEKQGTIIKCTPGANGCVTLWMNASSETKPDGSPMKYAYLYGACAIGKPQDGTQCSGELSSTIACGCYESFCNHPAVITKMYDVQLVTLSEPYDLFSYIFSMTPNSVDKNVFAFGGTAVTFDSSAAGSTAQSAPMKNTPK